MNSNFLSAFCIVKTTIKTRKLLFFMIRSLLRSTLLFCRILSVRDERRRLRKEAYSPNLIAKDIGVYFCVSVNPCSWESHCWFTSAPWVISNSTTDKKQLKKQTPNMINQGWFSIHFTMRNTHILHQTE